MILHYLFLALPLALFWMILVGRAEIASFIIGYVLAFVVMLLIRPRIRVHPARLPGQLVMLVIYSVVLFRDIVLSSIDVTRRVLDPRMPLKQGIIAVNTQDDAEDGLAAALSAHGITITPGELVVAFEDRHTMYVHCLDIEDSAPRLDTDQAKRLFMLKRILGRDG